MELGRVGLGLAMEKGEDGLHGACYGLLLASNPVMIIGVCLGGHQDS
jgi:hypothetical protein